MSPTRPTPPPPMKAKAPAPLVSTPVRTRTPAAGADVLRNFFSGMASSMPALKRDMEVAEIPKTPAQFIQDAVFFSLGIAALVGVVVLFTLSNVNLDAMGALLVTLIAPVLAFGISMAYSLSKPKAMLLERGRRIDQNLVFAGRHLLIELRAGMVLFDAMLGVSRDYGDVSKEFNKIVEKITLGVPAQVAMHEVAEASPSPYFRRLVLQMANSLSSGSDLAASLEVALDQIAQEQIIQLKAYGQKLNPLVMFFMLFGVILPSLGVAFLIILLSIVGQGLAGAGSAILVGVLLFLFIVQYLFLSIVENSRPRFDLA